MRTRVALLACLLSLAPTLASAQAAGAIAITESSSTSAGGKNDQVINIAECNGSATDSLTLRWTWGVATLTTANYFRVYATTAACPTSGTAPADSATIHELRPGFQQVPANSTGGSGPNPAIDVRTDLVQNLSGLSCSAAATINFCVLVFDGNAVTSTVQSGAGASGAIGIDVTTPTQPTSVSAITGDGALTVRWVPGAKPGSTWVVTATPDVANPTLNCTATSAPERTATCTGTSTNECRVTDLVNDACYSVTVQAFSDANNPSPASTAVVGVPRPVQDFWERYQADGGQEAGGCGAGTASVLSLLALAFMAPRLLRRRP